MVGAVVNDDAVRLFELATELGPDELRVLRFAAERLAMGRRQYGELRLDTDPRDFRKEASEEAIDGFLYSLFGLLKR